jgi:hypothetical protein
MDLIAILLGEWDRDCGELGSRLSISNERD